MNSKLRRSVVFAESQTDSDTGKLIPRLVTYKSERLKGMVEKRRLAEEAKKEKAQNEKDASEKSGFIENNLNHLLI